MEVIIYQLVIAVVIIIVGSISKLMRTIITVIACVFTVVMLFTTWLLILQFLTITISYYISKYLSEIAENSPKNHSTELEEDSNKSKAFLYIFFVIVLGICFNYYLPSKNSKTHPNESLQNAQPENGMDKATLQTMQNTPIDTILEIEKNFSTHNIQYLNLNDYSVNDEIDDPNNEALKSSLGNNYGYLKRYSGKYPYEVKLFEKGIIKEQLEKLLGDKFLQLFEKNFSVQTPIKLMGDIIFINGGAPHMFTSDEACIEINLSDNTLSVGILDQRKTIYFFTEKDNYDLNSSSVQLKDWIIKANTHIDN